MNEPILRKKTVFGWWVFGIGLEPHYVESKVTVYPGPVKVDYKTNRVIRYGAPSITIKKELK